MTNSIKLLDCTLRDGGYIIDWMFGREAIKVLMASLAFSNIDFIECGFLKECQQNPDKTFFNNIQYLEPLTLSNKNYTLMVNYGEYSINNFSRCKTKNIKIRVAFKKHNQFEALEYIKTLVELGWDVFINPMSTNTYSVSEIDFLIDEINKIKPYGVSIVDTLGNMHQEDILEIFDYFNNKLFNNIALGFHSHNSLQLSFSNAKVLSKMNLDREVIIDCCVLGMGRGAGNLCTELITQYLNENFGANYKTTPIIEVIDKYITPIYLKKQWGYSTPYYIAATLGCHPNYASYLVEKGVSDFEINKVLDSIPKDSRTTFDKELILKLCKPII